MINCPICDDSTKVLGTVNLNRCFSPNKIFTVSKVNITYNICDICDLIFSPEMCSWDKDKFTKYIYNKDYIKVDPDYKSVRPKGNAVYIYNLFKNIPPPTHLDYGGGNGLMSRLLKKYGYDSSSYDPFNNDILPNKKFNLITAFEVIEHHPNPIELLNDLMFVADDSSIIMFSTLISHNNDINWRYIAPRNGHIIVYSNNSLVKLFSKFGYSVHKIEHSIYIAYRTMPYWASKVFT